MTKYKIGVTKFRVSEQDFIASCSCGTVKLLGKLNGYALRNLNVTCEGCGNKKFLNYGTHTQRTVTPHLNVLEKNPKGFKVKRTNLSVIIDEEYNLSFKENQIQVMKYDLVNNEIKIWKNGYPVRLPHHVSRYPDSTDYQRFFHQVDDIEFLRLIKVAETESLFDMAWSDLSNGKNWSSTKKIYRGLVKLFDYKHLQILSNAGYPNVSRFKEYRYRNRNSAPVINSNGTTPRDIFGVPKFVLPYIRENQGIGIYEIEQIKKALTKVEVNRFKSIMEIVKDESTIRELCDSLEHLVEIHDKYDYKNMKKLTLYIFREIRMNQGISSPSNGVTLLRDYIRMATALGQEFEKYPKSLKKEHDVTLMNYKVKESELKQKEFTEKVKSEEYKSAELKTKEYAIVSPQNMDDLIKEGNELSHCVASYVDSIIKDNCKIYFMRMADSLDIPYATIEVRGDRVRQCRGYANRRLTETEREFVTAWAKKKNLEENYYY